MVSKYSWYTVALIVLGALLIWMINRKKRKQDSGETFENMSTNSSISEKTTIQLLPDDNDERDSAIRDIAIGEEGRHFYAIFADKVKKGIVGTGEIVKIYRSPEQSTYKNFMSGKMLGDRLFIVNFNEKDGTSTVLIFDKDDLAFFGRVELPKDLIGQFTLIDRVDDMYLGILMPLEKNQIERMRIVRFGSGWKVGQEWKLPAPLLNKLYGQSAINAAIGQEGKLFVRGNGVVYILDFPQGEDTLVWLDTLRIPSLPSLEGGIDISDELMMGTDPQKKRVVVYDLK